MDMFLIFTKSFADYSTHCYNDQILGVWEFKITKMNIKPVNDTVICPEKFVADKTFKITLTDPNIAYDESGHTGVWNMVYN